MDAFNRFNELIAERLGLQFHQRNIAFLLSVLEDRSRTLGFSTTREYLGFLENEEPENRREWSELSGRLTTGESFFFRDKGLFESLRTEILPDLLRRNGDRRSLRIWSAGCSSGEEVYSIAILLEETLPRDWNYSLLGVDLNPEAIRKAERGLYRSWSFRGTDPRLLNRYFTESGDEREVLSSLRAKVSFRQGNLIADPFPDRESGIERMDLVLCRNVFIYFRPDATARVVRKMADVLNEGGYLLTGHAELIGASLPPSLAPELFSHSMAYRKRPVPMGAGGSAISRAAEPFRSYFPGSFSAPPSLASKSPDLKELATPPRAASADERDPDLILRNLKDLLKQSRSHEALRIAEAILEREPENAEALALAAQACANLGRNEEAETLCAWAVRLAPLDHRPYYLLSHLAEERGDLPESERLLRKTLYLSPSFIPAYLDLRAIYESKNDWGRAERMKEASLQILRSLPPETAIDECDGMTAREILLQIEDPATYH
jgi:chemotaxis protein methyltransferase CheR